MQRITQLWRVSELRRILCLESRAIPVNALLSIMHFYNTLLEIHSDATTAFTLNQSQTLNDFAPLAQRSGWQNGWSTPVSHKRWRGGGHWLKKNNDNDLVTKFVYTSGNWVTLPQPEIVTLNMRADVIARLRQSHSVRHACKMEGIPNRILIFKFFGCRLSWLKLGVCVGWWWEYLYGEVQLWGNGLGKYCCCIHIFWHECITHTQNTSHLQHRSNGVGWKKFSMMSR